MRKIPEATIASGFAKAFLEFAVSKGADRQTLIKRSQLHPDDFTDHDRRIPLAKYVQLMKAGVKLCREPALGLLFGEEVKLPDISIVGLLGRGETAEESRRQAARYSRLAIDEGEDESPSPLEFVREGRDVWLKFNSAAFIQHPLLTESALARCVGAGAEKSESPGTNHWPCPKAFSFTHKEPPYRIEYDRIFRVPLFFESDKNAILFGEELLSVRLPPMNRFVFRLLIQQAEALLAKLESSKTVKGSVEKLVIPLLPSGKASAEVIAGKLGVSRQTLFRKLKAEGITFERLLDDLRRKLALHYLSENKTSVSETAYLVGFADAAAFSRAFKRWTGSNPRMFVSR